MSSREFAGPRLLEQPPHRALPKLALLVAPAGYGKSATAARLASESADALVIDDAHLLSDLEGTLQALWLEKPTASAIVCSRRPVVVPFGLALPQETRLVRADELRLTQAAVGELFLPLSASLAQVEQLYAATLGWPAAVFVALDRAWESGIAAAIGNLTALADRPLAQYVAGEVLSSLSEEARLLLLLASFKSLTFADGDALLGDRFDAALDEVEGSFLIRDRSSGAYFLHPLLKTAIEARLSSEARAAAVLLARRYERSHRPLRAARWYLQAGEAAAANAAYNQLTFARMAVISSDDSIAAGGLDESSLIANLAIFNVAAVEQLYTRDHDRWFAMAEEALRRAPAQVPSDVRVLAINMLVTRYAYFGRFDDAARFLSEQTALWGDKPEYQLVLDFCEAFCRAMHDEFVDLAELRRGLRPMLADPYGRASFAAIAAYASGVQGDWPSARTEWEAMIETLERTKQEMHTSEALMGATFFAWLNGDDERFRDWLRRLEATRASDGSAFFMRCVRGIDASRSDGYETAQVRVYGYLIAAASESDAGTARGLARRAAIDAERVGRPFFCVLAHLALGLLDLRNANEHFSKARALVEKIPSAELQRAVAAVASGAEDAGMLGVYRDRFGRERRDEGFLTVSMLAATMEWEGKPLTLKERPRQVILALALAETPLRGEELASRVWPDRDPLRMQNALRVHITAIRKASDPSVITYEDGRYRITKSHAVDLDADESLVRQAARSIPLGPSMRRTLEDLAHKIHRRVRTWDDLEWFAAIERRVDALWRTAIVTLAEDALHRHEPGVASDYASLLIERDACDERGRSIAIRAHVQAGHQTEAIREYRNYRRTVRDELGVDLSQGGESDEALQALVKAMRQ